MTGAHLTSQEQKKALRARIRERLARITPVLRQEASAAACALLREQPAWQCARAILFYAPMETELDLSPLLAEALGTGKVAALPRFDAERGAYAAVQVSSDGECAPGKFGIKEPGPACPRLPLNQLDLVLVPGVGFDLAGRRLGRGRGYFDRLLHEVSATKCGIAFDEQIVESVPLEPHDMLLDCILTPTRWLAVSPRTSVCK